MFNIVLCDFVGLLARDSLKKQLGAQLHKQRVELKRKDRWKRG
jgi:hypothetical protein